MSGGDRPLSRRPGHPVLPRFEGTEPDPLVQAHGGRGRLQPAPCRAGGQSVGHGATWQAHSNRSLGSAFRLLGDHQRAMEHFQVAQRLYTELGDVPEQAMNLHNLVAVFQALDLPEQALTHARQALELSEEIDDRQRQAIALNNLGWMYSNDGDQAAAIDCAQRALMLLDEADEVNLRAQLTRTLGQCQYRVAIAQQAAGHDAPARRAWQRALPMLSDLGDDLPPFESFAAEDASTRR
jgi:tetratricopeptide (TPR) repeat protein